MPADRLDRRGQLRHRRRRGALRPRLLRGLAGRGRRQRGDERRRRARRGAGDGGADAGLPRLARRSARARRAGDRRARARSRSRRRRAHRRADARPSRGRDAQRAQASRAAARSSRGWSSLPLPEEVELPPEDGETFAENALDKARAAHAATGLAGDRRRLGDRGVGARRAARGALGALRGPGRDRRGEPRPAPRASSRTRTIAGSPTSARSPTSTRTAPSSVVEGRCEGTLRRAPRGTGGFGYDPAFVPADTGPDDDRTMAELDAAREARDQPPRAAPRDGSPQVAGGEAVMPAPSRARRPSRSPRTRC